jgi:DNA topoisomerase-3
MAGIRAHARQLVTGNPEAEKAGGFGPCPQCGAPVVEGTKGFGCSRWKEGCGFRLWKQSAGAEIDGSLARELLDLGHTLQAVPVKAENGAPGLAVLELTKDGTVTAKPVKASRAGKDTKSLGSCPVCGGQVIAKPKLYTCSNEANGCPLRIWKTIAKRNITQAMVKQMLAEGITEPITDFTSKAGKPFTAKLKLEGGEVKMVFGSY